MKTLLKLTAYLLVIVINYSITGCTKKERPITLDISGFVQKGPFITGSSVTIYDLREDLSQTGISYNAQITDNSGSFNVKGATLTSGYVSIRADGFYFNEVSGTSSVSQITLYALADITDGSKINVNVLTHLEKARVEYLVGYGSSFSEAKAKAQNEILSVFSLNTETVSSSEALDISHYGTGNSLLLAISSILQGFRNESELTELLAGISNDLREDGIINEEGIGSKLFSHALLLDTASIGENLYRRYDELGQYFAAAGFGTYIYRFLGLTSYEDSEAPIKYPRNGGYGLNVLFLGGTQYASGIDNRYSFYADITANIPLKIRLTSLSADTIPMPASDSTEASNLIIPKIWSRFWNTEVNWTVSPYDEATRTQIFTATQTNSTCDVKLYFEKGSYLVEYFENNAVNPTKTRTIVMN